MSIENFKLNQTLARIVAANTVTPRIIPMLVGEAAIGKSSWARAFAAQKTVQYGTKKRVAWQTNTTDLFLNL